MTIPPEIAPLFHNYDVESIDAERHADLIVRTVLAYGTWEQVLWLFEQYGHDEVRRIFLDDLRGLRTLPEPVRVLWSLVFLGSREEGFDPADPVARWAWRRGAPPGPGAWPARLGYRQRPPKPVRMTPCDFSAWRAT